MHEMFWVIWRYWTHHWTRYAAAWIAAVGIAGWQQYLAAKAFRIPDDAGPERWRVCGNDGHTSIDFGGQWLMGRMLTKGYGRHLYQRDYQFEVAQAAYSRDLEPPDANHHDANELVLNWYISAEGKDQEARAPRRAVLAKRASAALPLGGIDGWQAAADLLVVCRE